jgi:aryl-alcohol dehydrogenase
MQITAAVARIPEADFTVESLTIEEPRADEILVRIAGVGLCHTDLVARDQLIPIPLPAVLGHEGSGVVERVGAAVTKVAPGDHVLISFNSCGHCKTCDEHLPSYCLEFPQRNYTGGRIDGSSALSQDGARVSGNFFGQSSFASHAIANERNVVKVDADLPLELLGPLGCGLQTGAGGVLRSLDCRPGSAIAIFGGGPVGLAAIMAARLRKCRSIILVEPMARRRELARELGATHVIDPLSGDVTAAIRAIEPLGVEYGFDSSGRKDVIMAGLGALTSHGVMGLVGVPPKITDELSFNIAWLITYGYRIQGIIEGDSDLDGFLPELLGHYRTGDFPFDRLVTTYPLSEINRAIAEQSRGDCVKAVLIP